VGLFRFPVHPGAIYGVVKELRSASEDFRPIVLAGAPDSGRELLEGLTAGGDPRAIRDFLGTDLSGYDVEGAGLLLYVIEGEKASAEDEQALRLADRKNVEAICVLVGEESAEPVDLPHVLATNVVRSQKGHLLPIEAIAKLIAERADERAYMWAGKLPALRPPVVEQVIEKFSRQNGILGVAIFIPGADLPVLTLNQIRMIFRLATAYGEEIDRDRAVEVLAVIGAGLGFRTVARQTAAIVPGVGWAIKGGIAYAGTRALGVAAAAFFEKGGQQRLKSLAGSVRPRS
jgi:uncharacterized protein (DUF697 family)